MPGQTNERAFVAGDQALLVIMQGRCRQGAGRDFRVTWPGGCGIGLAMMKTFFAACAFSLVLGLTNAGCQPQPPAKQESTPAQKETQSVNTNEVAVIKTTEGEMVIEFWPDVAPKTVENFIKLAKQGFYDGTCFHRVIKDFMIQGGDPKTKDASKETECGTGDPGYKIKAEFNERSHKRGVISMARSQHPDSAGSQFFICHGNPTFLDRQYTAFGKLIKGDDVLEKIATTATHPPDRPNKRMGVESIKIVAADSIK
jgi:peptidyl-prolyl cis-trans isomerase B (cyclophilin B)